MSRITARIITVVLLVLVGCASPQEPSKPPNLPQGSTNGGGGPINGGNTNNNNGGNNGTTGESIDPTALQNILGTYTGQITRQTSYGQYSQPFYMTLTTANYQGWTYLYVQLSSNGNLGPISVSAYMGMFVNSSTNPKSYYFMSQIQNIQALYEAPVSLQFDYFSPTQFSLSAKSCVTANGVVCLNQAPGVRFDYVTKQR